MEEKLPLVSIIMPVYGVEKYIEKAIQSVIFQDYRNWELLIINDGSKDHSRDIALQYSKKYDNIYLFDKENGGLSDARNYGLRLARGKYIHFFDSDDFIVNDFYSSYLPIIENENIDFLILGYSIDYYNKNDICKKIVKYETERLHAKIIDPLLFIGKLEPLLNFAWNKIFKRSFLLENQLFFTKGLSVIEDQDFFLKVLTASNNFLFVEGAKYHYIVRPRKTLSSSYNDSFLEMYKKSYLLYEGIYEKLNIPNRERVEKLSEIAYLKLYYLLCLLFRSDSSDKKKEFNRIFNDTFFFSAIQLYKPRSLYKIIIKNAFIYRLKIIYYYFFFRFFF